MYLAYVSKHKSNHEKQVILLMIPNWQILKDKSKEHVAKSEGEQWYYLLVKRLSAFLKRNNLYSLNWKQFRKNSFATENKFQLHKRVCKR